MSNLISNNYQIPEVLKSQGLVLRYDQIYYREQEINFISDVSGVRCFGQWGSFIIDLGCSNIYYKKDMCKVVDAKLDLISAFTSTPELRGAKLEWFNNKGYRDIKLSYKGRILKVFLASSNKVDEIQLISEARKLLLNSGLLENNI